jgi:hypothetical protein
VVIDIHILRAHQLAKELLERPDGFITASDGVREYIIEGFSRSKTHANMDDSVVNWQLKLSDCSGNIIR